MPQALADAASLLARFGACTCEHCALALVVTRSRSDRALRKAANVHRVADDVACELSAFCGSAFVFLKHDHSLSAVSNIHNLPLPPHIVERVRNSLLDMHLNLRGLLGVATEARLSVTFNDALPVFRAAQLAACTCSEDLPPGSCPLPHMREFTPHELRDEYPIWHATCFSATLGQVRHLLRGVAGAFSSNPDPRADMIALEQELASLKPDEYRLERFTTTLDGPSFLLVIMTSEQRSLLVEFGHTAAIDATHLLNQYSYPVFQVVVQDDRGCTRSTALIVTVNQQESTLRRAFTIVHDMTGRRWSPSFVLVDQATGQANALAALFESPGSPPVVHYCLFHTLRAIQNKLKAHERHDGAEEAFGLMREALMTPDIQKARTAFQHARARIATLCRQELNGVRSALSLLVPFCCWADKPLVRLCALLVLAANSNMLTHARSTSRGTLL